LRVRVLVQIERRNNVSDYIVFVTDIGMIMWNDLAVLVTGRGRRHRRCHKSRAKVLRDQLRHFV
jgi:hypothetical protein